MFLTLSNFFDDESSTIQVDSSVIDVSKFQDEEDQAFLITQGHELLRINAKAEHAKEQICKMIDQKADDAKGKIIYEIQERFNSTPELKGGLMQYFHSLGFWVSNMEAMGLVKPEKYTALSSAFRWANAYRAALEMHKKLAGEMEPEAIQEAANQLSLQSKAKIFTNCSEEDRQSIYSNLVAGKSYSTEEVNEMVKTPEIKLSKAEELLKEARIRKETAETRWSEAEVKGDLRHEVNNAESSIKNFEAKVAELQAQVDAKEAELTKFKFDEDVQRQTRIKVLTDALTVGVPQATADLNKYIKDAEYYPSDVRRHFDDQIKVLANMCGDYLSRI